MIDLSRYKVGKNKALILHTVMVISTIIGLAVFGYLYGVLTVLELLACWALVKWILRL